MLWHGNRSSAERYLNAPLFLISSTPRQTAVILSHRSLLMELEGYVEG
jgi:hypothetical protein